MNNPALVGVLNKLNYNRKKIWLNYDVALVGVKTPTNIVNM